jgi:hypothetical protein
VLETSDAFAAAFADEMADLPFDAEDVRFAKLFLWKILP